MNKPNGSIDLGLIYNNVLKRFLDQIKTKKTGGGLCYKHLSVTEIHFARKLLEINFIVSSSGRDHEYDPVYKSARITPLGINYLKRIDSHE